MPENPTLTTDLTGQAGKLVKVKSDESGFEFQAGGGGGGDLVAANNLSDVANATTARNNLGAAAALGSDDNYVTDAEKVKVAAIDQVFTSTEKTKLSGIATGATANSSDATLLNTDNHTDGTTNKVFSATNKTKLAGIATGATANDTDANLKNTDNHTDGTTNKVYSATDKTKLAGISAGAQVNSAITKAEIEAKLTGAITSHAHDYVATNVAITGATKAKITYDSKGLVTAGADLAAGDIPTLTSAKISDFTTAAQTAAPAETGATIRTALGTTTAGAALNTVTNPSAITYPRINADNSVTTRTPAQVLSDIGGQAAGSYLTASNIVATITNGNTTTAPSEDAVFDALATKDSANSAEFSQVVVSGTAYYITGSSITIPVSTLQVGSSFTWRLWMSKTAAGTGTFQMRVYRGTNGSTADTADVTQTLGTQTAVVDSMVVDITINITATGATGSYFWTICPMNKAATATGFGIATGTTGLFSGTVSSVALNTANLKFGISFIATTGTPTVRVAQIVKSS